jgi:hypothetical protein
VIGVAPAQAAMGIANAARALRDRVLKLLQEH